MDKLKKIIIIFIVIIIILMIIIFAISKKNKIKQPDEFEYYPTEEINYEENSEKIEQVKEEVDFFSLESILKKYCLYVKVENETAVYNILDEEYINDNNITTDNIIKNLKSNINYNGDFELTKAYVRDDIYKPIYYCFGQIVSNNKQKTKVYYKINIDKNTMSFCITPLLEKEYNDFVEENKIEENNKSVSRNKYNEFNKIVLEKEKIAKKYFDDYIYNAVSNSEEAYKLLNEEYRTKRFPNINEYKEYIKQNIEQLETLDAKGIKSFEEFNDEDKYKEYIGKLQLKGIEQYNITNKDKYKQIECVDVYGNYYLFNVKAAMDYTVILDAYTIDLPDVLEKYNSSSNENKVAMNIEKIKTAINNKDYRYVYNKLNNTFKETNFKTEESLKEYLQNNIYINNNFECSSVQKQDNVYVAQVKVMNMDNTTQTKKIKVVMKLKEGTDYEMSFSIQ